MILLDFISRYETVQAILALGLGIMGIIVAAAYLYRKSKLTDAVVKERTDKVEEHEHARKIEWHNVTHAPQIAGETRGSQQVDDPDRF